MKYIRGVVCAAVLIFFGLAVTECARFISSYINMKKALKNENIIAFDSVEIECVDGRKYSVSEFLKIPKTICSPMPETMERFRRDETKT